MGQPVEKAQEGCQEKDKASNSGEGCHQSSESKQQILFEYDESSFFVVLNLDINMGDGETCPQNSYNQCAVVFCKNCLNASLCRGDGFLQKNNGQGKGKLEEKL